MPAATSIPPPVLGAGPAPTPAYIPTHVEEQRPRARASSQALSQASAAGGPSEQEHPKGPAPHTHWSPQLGPPGTHFLPTPTGGALLGGPGAGGPRSPGRLGFALTSCH